MLGLSSGVKAAQCILRHLCLGLLAPDWSDCMRQESKLSLLSLFCCTFASEVFFIPCLHFLLRAGLARAMFPGHIHEYQMDPESLSS